MKVSMHAVKRFVQRVLQKEPTKENLYQFSLVLNKLLGGVEVRGVKGYVVMPGFSDFVAAYENGVFTTVLKKEWVKKEMLYKSGKLSRRDFLKSKL
jgi:hypothetical protein